MLLAESFVQFTADTKSFDVAVDRVHKKLTDLAKPFEALSSLGRKVFFGLAAAAGIATAAFASQEAADNKLRASLRASFEQAKQNTDQIGSFAAAIARVRGRSIEVNARITTPAGGIKLPNVTGDIEKQTDAATDSLKKFASTLQRITVYEDDAIENAMAFALNLGVTEDAIKGVTKVGIGLAERFFGGDLKAGMEAAAKAYQGNFRELQRLIPGLKDAANNQEKWNSVVQQGTLGFDQAKARTNSFNGQLLLLKNSVSDLAENFGAKLTPYLQVANRWMLAISERLKQLTPEQTQQIVKWAGITAGVAAFVGFGPRIVNTIGALTTIVRGLSTTLINVGVTALRTFGGVMRSTWAIAAANPFTLAILAVAGLATGIAYLGGTGDTAFERIGNGFANFNNSVQVAWKKTVTFFSDLWNRFAATLKSSLGSSFDTLKTALAEVTTYWSKVLGGFLGFAGRVFGAFGDGVTGTLSTIGSFFGTVFTTIAKSVGQVVGYIGSIFSEGFSVIGGVVTDFASVFAAVADVMFGSWRGFTEGAVTLWHQAGFVLLKSWYGIKDIFLNLWEDIKFAGKAVFYYWGGVVAEFGTNVMTTFKEVIAFVRNAWDRMIDYLASRMASIKVRSQAEGDVRKNFEGKTIGDKEVKQLQIQLGLSAQQAQSYKGRQLSEDEIGSLVEGETNRRIEDQRKIENKITAQRQRELDERMRAAEAENKAVIDRIRKWSDQGLADSSLDRDKNKAGNNAERDKQLKDIEAARLADLQKDLERMKNLPKLSDKASAALDAIKKGMSFDKVKELLKSITDGYDKLKVDSDKDLADTKAPRTPGNFALDADAKKPGRTIEDTFKENLRNTLVGGLAISRQQEAEKAQKREEMRLRQLGLTKQDNNTKALDNLTKVIVDLGNGQHANVTVFGP